MVPAVKADMTGNTGGNIMHNGVVASTYIYIGIYKYLYVLDLPTPTWHALRWPCGNEHLPFWAMVQCLGCLNGLGSSHHTRAAPSCTRFAGCDAYDPPSTWKGWHTDPWREVKQNETQSALAEPPKIAGCLMYPSFCWGLASRWGVMILQHRELRWSLVDPSSLLPVAWWRSR